MNMHVSVLVTIYKSSAAKVCSFHQILKRFPDLQMFQCAGVLPRWIQGIRRMDGVDVESLVYLLM